MINPSQLLTGIPYFHLNYCDEQLRVPEIRVLYFLREDEGAWLFQGPEEYFAQSSAPTLSLASLAAVFDQGGLVIELGQILEFDLTKYPEIPENSVEFPGRLSVAFAVCTTDCGAKEFIVDGSTQRCQHCGKLMFRTEVAEYSLES